METIIDKKYFSCDCGACALMVQDYTEIYGDRYIQEFNLALFRFGEIREKPSFIERLKYAFRHLKTGKKYEDEIILSDKEAKKLAHYLLYRISKYKLAK